MNAPLKEVVQKLEIAIVTYQHCPADLLKMGKMYTLKMAPELDSIPMIVRIVVYVTASCEY